MRQGRPCHRWWARGKRPPGIQDRRRDWACLFGAARPDGEAAFALVLPAGNTDTMRIFLDRVAGTLAGDEPAVMGLDGAGWHGARARAEPPNVTLVPVPPQSPQLAPMERAWLRLPERFLSLRVPDGHEAIVDACCTVSARRPPFVVRLDYSRKFEGVSSAMSRCMWVSRLLRRVAAI